MHSHSVSERESYIYFASNSIRIPKTLIFLRDWRLRYGKCVEKSYWNHSIACDSFHSLLSKQSAPFPRVTVCLWWASAKAKWIFMVCSRCWWWCALRVLHNENRFRVCVSVWMCFVVGRQYFESFLIFPSLLFSFISDFCFVFFFSNTRSGLHHNAVLIIK